MRKFVLYFLAVFVLTSCDNLKTKDINTEDDSKETVKKKKKPVNDEEENNEEENNEEENNNEDDAPKRKVKPVIEEDPEDAEKDESTTVVKGWKSAEKKAFMQNCVGSASSSMGQDKAESYCSCMMQKIEKRYPDANNVSQLSESEMTSMAKDCLY